MSKYDAVVIGSGPGGYVAAIRCAQVGLKTAIIERYATLGGTCLNVGCIPSKALLDSSEHYENATKHFTEHGIDVGSIQLDWPKMLARKDKVISDTCQGVDYLMKKNKIDVYHGHGSFTSPTQIEITQDDGKKESMEAKNTIIATGSKPSSIPNITLDKKRVITSTEALSLPEVPQEMIVIGGGIIGLELGSVYCRLGTKVKVVEFLDKIIFSMDETLSKEMLKIMKKQGLEFFLKHQVQSVETKGEKVTVIAKDPKGGTAEFQADYCLMSVGRRPYTENLGLDKAGVRTDERGFIPINQNLQTSVPNIYAIGDVVGGAMLAHKAEEEGVYVAELLGGQKPHINYRAIPNVLYTWPEAAGVGYTEQELKAEGRQYKVGSFPYSALGRARAANETAGLVKVIADKETDEILGVHMLGARVADMIAEGVVALEYRASAEDIARMSHAHPTFTESIKEACLAATANRPLHL